MYLYALSLSLYVLSLALIGHVSSSSYDMYPPPVCTLSRALYVLSLASYEEEDTCHMRRRIHVI
jgi:hypothetical protein